MNGSPSPGRRLLRIGWIFTGVSVGMFLSLTVIAWTSPPLLLASIGGSVAFLLRLDTGTGCPAARPVRRASGGRSRRRGLLPAAGRWRVGPCARAGHRGVCVAGIALRSSAGGRQPDDHDPRPRVLKHAVRGRAAGARGDHGGRGGLEPALPRGLSREERKVIIASSLGTIFEWYDFFLYGALANVIARQFFAQADAQTSLIFALLAFAAGFIVRPLGRSPSAAWAT